MQGLGPSAISSTGLGEPSAEQGVSTGCTPSSLARLPPCLAGASLRPSLPSGDVQSRQRAAVPSLAAAAPWGVSGSFQC